tara:strand:+ start:9526 stop:9894 length:369 start_codon:yes stop_codon:yes gene_type:complete
MIIKYLNEYQWLITSFLGASISLLLFYIKERRDRNGNNIEDGSDKDWRLQGQEEYLKGVPLVFKKWRKPREEWDHDHCEFCWAKFAEFEGDDIHRSGFADEDNNHWVCEKCYNDFKVRFEWN